MDNEKKELQEQYEKLYSKKAFAGWDEQKLKDMISAKQEKEKEEIEIDPYKTYVFKLKGEHSPVVFFPSEMETFDEDAKRSRQIRCVSIEESPYVEEQDANSSVDDKPVIFTDGIIRLQGTESNRIKYLLATDAVYGKKKTLPKNGHLVNRFELEDKQALSKANLKKEDDILDALQLIRKAPLSDVKDFLRSHYLSNVDDSSKEDVLVEASAKVKETPALWLKDFNNPKHKIKADIQRLFNKGELDDSRGNIKWRKSDGNITTYDENLDARADEVLAKFAMLDTKESKDFKKTMEEKLS